MFLISRVLVPVVFSDNCRGALRFAADIASRFDAELTVLHVLEPVKRMDFDSPSALEELEKSRKDWVHKALTDITFDLRPRLAVTESCVEGDPATEIVRTAESSHADLIVIATHGYGPLRRFLLGSVTAKVLHDAGCPVWTGAHLDRVLSQTPSWSRDWSSVLCAVDFESQTDSMLRWSAGIAEAYGAHVVLVHVVAHGHDSDQEHRARAEALARLDHWSRTISVKSELMVVAGAVTEQVACVARTVNADLLVIGRGHMKGGGRLRSTSYAIIRESPCPVVSV